MARKKSLNELNAQIRRISNMGTGSYKDIARRLKANQIYNLYKENIQNTEQFKRDWEESTKNPLAGLSPFAGLSARIKSTVGDRKYSHREYMGLANG